MEINNKVLYNNQINTKGKAMEKTLEQKQLDAMRNLYKKACNEIPAEPDFKDINEEYANFDETYVLSIAPGYNKEKPEELELKVGLLTRDNSHILHTGLLIGSKQEIIDFLGNEKNSTLISANIKHLKKCADRM